MHKKLWNSVYVQKGELSVQLIKNLIDYSYDMVMSSLPLKVVKKLK